jgi:hypothetical protein
MLPQPNLEQRFKSFDKNNDGKVTREEFGAPSSGIPWSRFVVLGTSSRPSQQTIESTS